MARTTIKEKETVIPFVKVDDFGNAPSDPGPRSVAIGGNVRSSSTNAVAIGYFAYATDSQAIALGQGAYARDFLSISIGGGSRAIANGALSLGEDASSEADNAIAIGSNTDAEALASIAIGQNASATADGAVQIGTGTNAAANSLQFQSNRVANTTGIIAGPSSGAPAGAGTTNEIRFDSGTGILYIYDGSSWLSTTLT